MPATAPPNDATDRRSHRQRRRLARVPVDPDCGDVWTLAFAGGRTDMVQAQLPERLAELTRYAQTNGGLRVLGFRLAVQAHPDVPGSPTPARVRRLLKRALRELGLRCVEMSARAPWAPAPQVRPPGSTGRAGRTTPPACGRRR